MIRITKKNWLWTTLAVVLLGGIAAGGYYCLLHQVKTIIAEAETLYLNGNYGQAFDAYRKIPTWQIALLSPLEQADLDINCGNCLYEMRKYADAIPFFARAAKQVEECNLLNKIEAPAQLYNRWGEGFETQKKYQQAESIYLRGIDNLRKKLGNYSGIALLQARLGELYLDTGNYRVSIIYWNLVLSNSNFMKRQDDSEKSIIYRCLAAAYCHTDNLAEAATTCETYISFTEKSYGKESPQMGVAYAAKALIFYKQKKRIEAIKLLDNSYSILEKKCGKEYCATRQIAKLREKWENEPDRKK